MAKYVANGAKFKCMLASDALTLLVPQASMESEGQNIATEGNYSFPPPLGGLCYQNPVSMPCTPSATVIKTGKSYLEVDHKTALVDTCQFMCAKGGKLNCTKPGQKTITNEKPGKIKSPRRPSAKTAEDKAIEEYFVYQVRDENTGEVIYAGITNDIERRRDEHFKEKGFTELEKIKTNTPLTKKDAKAIEQALIEIHGRVKDKNGKRLGEIV